MHETWRERKWLAFLTTCASHDQLLHAAATGFLRRRSSWRQRALEDRDGDDGFSFCFACVWAWMVSGSGVVQATSESLLCALLSQPLSVCLCVLVCVLCAPFIGQDQAVVGGSI